jgi:non-heme chloroperoxidase
MKNVYTNYYRTQDGERIFYSTNFEVTDEFHDQVLVFNYGLVCSNHHWTPQIEYFDSIGKKILLHDYRGHFHSSGIGKLEAITFSNITSDIYGLITKLKMRNVVMLGHSMGVNIALEFAKRFPELVNKLILISGNVVPVYSIMFNSNVVEQLKPLIIKLFNKHPDAFSTFWKFSGWNPIVRKIIHIGGFNIDQVSEEFIEIYLNKIGQLGPDLFFQLIDEMNKHNILASLNNIKTQSLIIGGDNDKVIPNYLQRLLFNNLPNAQIYLLKNGSHVPQVDFPNYTNERIEFFINS